MELPSTRTHPEVLVVHARALLTPRGRLELAICIVEDGWPLHRAAERFQVSVPTAVRRRDRYLALTSRSRRSRRWATGARGRTTARGRSGRQRSARWCTCGPYANGGRPGSPSGSGMQASTVNRVLRREGCLPLNELDLATRRALRGKVVRYERERPGELVHVDIKNCRDALPAASRRAHAGTTVSARAFEDLDSGPARDVEGR